MDDSTRAHQPRPLARRDATGGSPRAARAVAAALATAARAAADRGAAAIAAAGLVAAALATAALLAVALAAAGPPTAAGLVGAKTPAAADCERASDPAVPDCERASDPTAADADRAPVYDGPELDYQPSIARLRASGGLALVFERLDGLSFAGDLYWTSSSDGGATWEVPRAAVATDASERHPALVQLAGGTLALFYLVDETGDGGYRLHRATSADGAEWTDAGAIYLGWPTPGEVNPDVIAEPDGSLTMTYHRLSGPSYIARSLDDGATWDTERTQVSLGSAALPRITRRDSDGMYLVTYQTNPGDNDLDLWSRRSRDPRDWTATPVAVSVARNSHDSQPLALPDGTFVVVYSEQAGSAFDVRYRHSSDGASWSDASLVTNWPTQYDTQPHAVVGAGPSTVVLAWSHQDGDRPYVDHDVWVEPALDLDIQRQAPLHLPLGYSGGATR